MAAALTVFAALAAAPAAPGAELAAQGREFELTQRPSPPPYFAIRGARIVVGDGRVIDRGTVVVEEGLITAVGRNVDIPERARVFEGEGLTVYPGFFDALTTLGHPSAPGGGARAAAQRQGSANDTYSRGPDD
ncbi:MAG: hypothetical protein D6701_09255, partial [Gemmatimonadetes bacterium]